MFTLNHIHITQISLNDNIPTTVCQAAKKKRALLAFHLGPVPVCPARFRDVLKGTLGTVAADKLTIFGHLNDPNKDNFAVFIIHPTRIHILLQAYDSYDMF